MKTDFEKLAGSSTKVIEAVYARLHADKACRRVFYSARRRRIVGRPLPQRPARSRPDCTVAAVSQAAPRTPSDRGIHRKSGEGFDSHHPTFRHLTSGEVHECTNACHRQTENQKVR